MSNTFDDSILEERIGYKFKDRSLLMRALTHSSYTNEQKINKVEDYERLEFLGDAVLELVTSETLFREHPEMKEGQLTKLRASMVCEQALAYCAKDIKLGDFIKLGKGEEASGGRNRESITSDVMEALIGAMYLDGGMDVARKHIETFILNDLEEKVLFVDSKSSLQELIQGVLHRDFEYEFVGEKGPEHDKTFEVKIVMDGEEIGRGEGRTKKAAQQAAAYEALVYLRGKGYVFKKY
ncbi:MAG: ribonuclease III [Acetatifactor sp.]|nr:ribonuclease III [Acetatifactor sp.]